MTKQNFVLPNFYVRNVWEGWRTHHIPQQKGQSKSWKWRLTERR